MHHDLAPEMSASTTDLPAHSPPLHRPSAPPKSRPQRQAGDGSVLASALARHLDVSRQRIAQMAYGA